MNENKGNMEYIPVDIEERAALDLAEEVYSLRQAIWALVKAIKTSK